ncbi:MAG: hypothetical protein J4215_03305 [Candidatus Diapherotrites archaeon]|uniref:Uncharacterized protein n=1 Tax=Candidatus Iainarchaeum sp. TaxID=3101447 RepID=A0A8T4L2T4_9ARCH|nr:hypothetical protein [Candidatus Diapherotrites archaeon]
MKNQWKSLAEIPASEWIQLQRRVEKANGRVVVLVHPFFGDVKNLTGPEKYERYRQAVSALLHQSKVPVVILEEYKKTGRLASELKARNEHVLILPTNTNEPHLVLSFDKDQEPLPDEAYKELSKHLRFAGAKFVSIGGCIRINGCFDPM